MALHQLEEVSFGGFHFLIRPGSSDIKTLKEVFDQDSYRQKRIEPGEQWLDLGAAIGAFSLLAHGRGAPVIAFEPDPDSYDLLIRNLDLNGIGGKSPLLGAQALAVVADKRKTTTFFTNPKTGGHWRNSTVRRIKSSQEITVPCINYRQVFEEWGHSPICVKMDIEGAEIAILEDIQPEQARRIKKLMCEYSFDADRSIARYHAVVQRLETMFEYVHARPIWKTKPDEREWKWWPFYTMIYCHNLQSSSLTLL